MQSAVASLVQMRSVTLANRQFVSLLAGQRPFASRWNVERVEQTKQNRDFVSIVAQYGREMSTAVPAPRRFEPHTFNINVSGKVISTPQAEVSRVIDQWWA